MHLDFRNMVFAVMWKRFVITSLITIAGASLSRGALADDYCVVPALGPDPGTISQMFGLSEDTLLIEAENGIFRLNRADGAVTPVGGIKEKWLHEYLYTDEQNRKQEKAIFYSGTDLLKFDYSRGMVPVDREEETGVIKHVYRLPQGDILVEAERGWFYFDALSVRIRRGAGPELEEIFDSYDLKTSRTFVRAKRGLFLLDQAGYTSSAIGSVATGRVFQATEGPRGRVLIEAERGLFQYDPSVAPLPVALPVPATGDISNSYESVNGVQIVYSDEKGLFRIDPTTGIVTKLNIGKVSNFVVSGHALLLRTDQGLFRSDPTTGILLPIAASETGRVIDLFPKKVYRFVTTEVLVQAERGVFRLDPEKGILIPIAGPQVGQVIDVVDTHEFGQRNSVVLVQTEHNLFRLSSPRSSMVEMGSVLGPVHQISAVPGGSVLIAAGYGLFYVDAENNTVTKVRETEIGEIKKILKLGSKQYLIQTDQELFRLDPVTKTVLDLGSVHADTIRYPSLGKAGS